MSASGIDLSGDVQIGEDMSGLEPEPKDDWMYLGLRTIHDIATEKGAAIRSAAGIGSGNGIMEIAMLKQLTALKTLYVTDILERILPAIRKNIGRVISQRASDVSITYVAGADCDPLTQPVDLIYGNLPLIMTDPASLEQTLATTTLTDSSRYLSLSTGENDALLRWSMLSQLGFLLSAKKHLNLGGSIVTLLGGRVPYEIITETFARAGLRFKERYCAFKVQADPQFLRDYADYERTHGVEFCFYDYAAASAIIKRERRITVPDVIPLKGDELKMLIKTARLNAADAYAYALQEKAVGHLAFAFEAFQ